MPRVLLARLRVIHVSPLNMRLNAADSSKRLPEIVWRDVEDLDTLHYVYRVELLSGGSVIGPIAAALPHSDGKGTCPIVCDCPIKVWEEPLEVVSSICP